MTSDELNALLATLGEPSVAPAASTAKKTATNPYIL